MPLAAAAVVLLFSAIIDISIGSIYGASPVEWLGYTLTFWF